MLHMCAAVFVSQYGLWSLDKVLAWQEALHHIQHTGCSGEHPVCSVIFGISPIFLLVSAGRLLCHTYQVPSHPQSYDAQLASNLWNVSADFCQLPKAVSKKQT